jgi:hypothetical protein
MEEWRMREREVSSKSRPKEEKPTQRSPSLTPTSEKMILRRWHYRENKKKVNFVSIFEIKILLFKCCFHFLDLHDLSVYIIF